MRKLGILAMVLGLVLMTMPAAGADSASRPFTGSAVGSLTFPTGTECENYGGANVRTDGHATGTASHLGQTIVTTRHCTPEGPELTGGKMMMVAANGDLLYLDYEGVNSPPDPDTGILVSATDFVITGGSGRFEGAQGEGVFIAYVVFEGIGDPEWPVRFVWEGTIGY
jgi:hypothetical protein